jgi:competence protein ComEA
MIEWLRLNLFPHSQPKRFPAAVLLAALSPLSLAAQELPDGPGKSAMQQACVKCHDLKQVIARRRTAVDWEMTVDKMITQGAKATDAQLDQILDYLIKYYRKPINANQASARSLEAELELTPQEAAAIVAYREKNPAFKSVEDLKKVPGLDAGKVDAAKEWLAF